MVWIEFWVIFKKISKRRLNWSNDHSSKSLIPLSPNLIVLSSPNPEQQDRSLLPKQLHHFPSGICTYPFFIFVHFIFDLFLFFLNFAISLFAQMKMPRTQAPLLAPSSTPLSWSSLASFRWLGFPSSTLRWKKGDSIRELSSRPMIGRLVKILPKWTCQGWLHPMLSILQRWLYSWIVKYSLTFFLYIRFQDFSDYMLMFDLF